MHQIVTKLRRVVVFHRALRERNIGDVLNPHVTSQAYPPRRRLIRLNLYATTVCYDLCVASTGDWHLQCLVSFTQPC